MALTKFKIKTELTMGMSGFYIENKLVKFEDLTDAQAEKLLKEKQPYIEAIPEVVVKEK